MHRSEAHTQRMEESSNSILSPSTPLCNTQLDESVDEINSLISPNIYGTTSCTEDQEDNEYIQMLLQKEINTVGFKSIQLPSQHFITNWSKCARLDAITWILNTRALFGFRYQTAYLSVSYFDEFLSRRVIDSEKTWAIRLLSVACLSLAAKMEECRVPALSDFPVEDFSFESKVIQRMELLVLNSLEWKMGLVTPFAYIHYFITKLCKDSPPREMVSTSVQLILGMMRDVNLVDHRPSVIAVAATLVALDQTLTKQSLESHINYAFSSNGFLEIGDVVCCYNRMKELDLLENKVPTYLLTEELSSAELGGIDGFEKSSVTCAVSTKTKRVGFNIEFDQHCGIQEKKRRC